MKIDIKISLAILLSACDGGGKPRGELPDKGLDPNSQSTSAIGLKELITLHIKNVTQQLSGTKGAGRCNL